jgi:MFS family permease
MNLSEPLRTLFAGVFRILPVRIGEDELTGEDPRLRESLPSSFAAIALNGLFFPTAGRILGAGLLLTWFVSDLSPSAVLVAVIVPIQYGLALIGQPYIAQLVSGQPYRARLYTAQSLIRAASWISLGLLTYFSGSPPVVLLIIFFVVIVVDAVAAGLGNIAFNDTLAKVIPKNLRGRARSWRGIFGGIAAGLAGIMIGFYFSDQSGIGAFGLLFASAGICYAVGGLIIGIIDEPRSESAKASKPEFSELWVQLRRLWSGPAFRRFVYAESLLVPIMQALPFFTLFARRDFGLETESLGILVIMDAAAPIAGNLIWGRLADAVGNRRVMIISAVCGLIPALIGIFLYANGEASGVMLIGLVSVVVFLVGITSIGIDLTTKNYILDLAADDAERPLYIGVNDSLVGLPTTLLVGAGFVIDLYGFLPVFVGLLLCTTVGVFIAAGLPDH